MKIRIEVDNKIKENEVIIRCSELSEDVKNIQIMLGDMLSRKKQITFYKGDTEYYLSLEGILFLKLKKMEFVHIQLTIYIMLNISFMSLKNSYQDIL